MRIIVFWGLYWGPPVLGNCHLVVSISFSIIYITPIYTPLYIVVSIFFCIPPNKIASVSEAGSSILCRAYVGCHLDACGMVANPKP